jgi:hypothetical protein
MRISAEIFHHHTFDCPVYILATPLQQGKLLTAWVSRAQVGVNIGISPTHACSVALVLSLRTGLASPQFHVKHDDLFETTAQHLGGYRMPALINPYPCLAISASMSHPWLQLHRPLLLLLQPSVLLTLMMAFMVPVRPPTMTMKRSLLPVTLTLPFFPLSYLKTPLWHSHPVPIPSLGREEGRHDRDGTSRSLSTHVRASINTARNGFRGCSFASSAHNCRHRTKSTNYSLTASMMSKTGRPIPLCSPQPAATWQAIAGSVGL